MHQIRFRLGLRPRPHWESLQRSQAPQLELKEPTSKGREGMNMTGGKGEGGEEGMEGDLLPRRRGREEGGNEEEG